MNLQARLCMVLVGIICVSLHNVAGFSSIGCFGEQQPPLDRVMSFLALSRPASDVSIEACVSACGKNDYTFAAGQTGCACWCGNDYSRLAPSAPCNMSCCGDQSQMCGNYWVNSVYTVCDIGSFYWDGVTCTRQCGHCSEKMCHLQSGICLSPCDSGWSGSDCAVPENCITAEHKCNQVCTNTTVGIFCACYSGYKLEPDNRTCTDINECSQMPKLCSQTCTNTEGSFTCSCDNGYNLQPDRTSCKDYDECLNYADNQCEHNCTNIPGSFHCTCRDGYELAPNGKNCKAHITEFAQLPGLRGLYAFGLDKRDYRNAQQTCAQQLAGAHLAVIRNQGEQDVIVNHIRNAGYDCRGFHIGGQRENHNCDSRFVWTFSNNEDSFPLRYTNWCTGEPNCVTGQQTTISILKERDYCWVDGYWDVEECFISEYQPL